MTERNRWDSKRRSPLLDPRRGTSSSSSSGSGRGSYDREKDRDRDRDHRRDRSYRHDKDKDKDKDKKDRYHDNHSSHHRKHSNDSHRSDSRDRSSDSSNSHRSNRHDEHRGSSHDNRNTSSQQKSSYNHKHRDSPSNSSYSSSTYSTPPPAPPGPPPAPPIAHTTHVLPSSQQHHIAPVGNAASHLAAHPLLHATVHPSHSSPLSGVKSQQVGLSSSLHHVIHTIAPTVQNVLTHYQTQSNIYIDNSANHSTPSNNTNNKNNNNRPDPRLSERRTSDPRRNASANTAPVVEEVKKNFKLLIDPAIKKGHAKVIRYDGVLTGQPPVTPKDPRRIKSKIWTIDVCDLPVPEFKIDKNYVGPMPKNIVRFSGLNDNVNRQFLYELCEAYGDMKEYKVYFDPKTNKHLGTGKVVFEEKTDTDKVVTALNNRQVMGNAIKVWIDMKKPPGLSMLKQLQLECLKARPPPSQSGLVHHLNSSKSRHMKTPQLSTPPTPKISEMNRNHPVAGGYNHTQAGYSSMDSTGAGGYYKNTNNPSPRLVSTPPPPPPKKHYEDISPTGREPDRNIYNNGQYLPYKSNSRDKPNLSLSVSRTKSTSYNSISNSKSGISPISPAIKDLTPTGEKVIYPNYESISDNERLPHVEDISPAGTPTSELDLQNSMKVNKAESDDAMSLSSISSNEESKVELNVSSQLLSQTTQTQNIQPVMIPVSDQLSTNQSVMNYIARAPLQHLYPATLRPPQPCAPPSQPHQPMQTHPTLQQVPPHQSPHLQSSPRPQTPLHQPSSKSTSHQLPPQCPPTQICPPTSISYQQQQPPPQTHPPPPQYQQHQHHPQLPQNRPSSHQAGTMPGTSNKYDPKALLQRQIYHNRSGNTSHPNSVHSTSLPNSVVKNNHSDSSLKTNYHSLRPPVPQSVSEKHADIIRKALYGQNIAASAIANYPQNYTPTQPYPVVPPPIRQPPPIPKELPFLFQVKSGVARDLSIELKQILKKDTLKKLVEHSAFACFENWWEKLRTSQNQTTEMNKIEPVKFESNPTRKLLVDKTTNVSTSNAVQTGKDATNTTSVLIQNLFSREKNNENRPPPSTPKPSKFLNTYRISRKEESQTNMKVSHISRKRRPWPSLKESKRKLQRLEDSEDEDMDDDEEETADEDNQFEQFAMKQRQKQKSGSSLYQKIYSDESDKEDEEDEDEDDGKGAHTQSEDEDEPGKPEVLSSLSSSSSSESSTSSSSSESEISESEIEDGIEEEPFKEVEPFKKSDEEMDSVPSPVLPSKPVELKTPSSPESETEEEVTEADDEIEPDDEAEESSGKHKVAFRSMYDEPRRKAVQDAERRMKELHAKLKGKKVKSRESKVSQDTDTSSDEEPPREKTKTHKESREEQVKPLETDKEKETDEKHSSDSSIEVEEEEESVVEDDSTPEDEPPTPVEKEAPVEPIVEDLAIKEEKEPDEDELMNKIIFEHSYFFKSPSVNKVEAKDLNETRSEKFLTKTLDSLMESEGIYSTELKHRFTMRTHQDETNIIWDIIKEGVDGEDLVYLKEAFESLVQIGAKEIDNLCWVDHPITIIPPPKVKRGKAETRLRVHKSGCARTEGYYKIPLAEKAQYLKTALKQLNIMQKQDPGTNNTSTQAGTEQHKMKSRENRAMQRRLASSIAQEEYGCLLNYNQTLKMRKRYLKFARSHIHNWGLFACEPIAAEEFVCEYIGQMIRSIVAEVREQRYEKSGIGSSYLFRLDMDSVIDATKIGCNARFVNHSCQPNCYAKVILVEGAKKIVIYSKRDIKIGEEITYDYKFPIEDDKIPCLCGAPQCRGSLN